MGYVILKLTQENSTMPRGGNVLELVDLQRVYL